MRRGTISTFFTLISSFLLLLGSIVNSIALPSGQLSRRDAISNEPEVQIPHLRKRDVTPPVPDVDTCKQHLTVPKDKAVFYSSAVIQSAKAYAKSIGGVTIWEAGATDYFNILGKEIDDALAAKKPTWDIEENNQFWQNMSKAFAQLASGNVPVVLPAGGDGKPELPATSLFTTVEWPILKDSRQNAGVTKVTSFVGNTNGKAPNDAGSKIWPC